MNKMNEALRDLFLKSKFTQEKFAKVLGISRNRLCKVIYNKQKLKYVTFMKYQEKYENYLERLEKTNKLKSGFRNIDLATEYNVSQQLICDIKKYRRWKDII